MTGFQNPSVVRYQVNTRPELPLALHSGQSDILQQTAFASWSRYSPPLKSKEKRRRFPLGRFFTLYDSRKNTKLSTGETKLYSVLSRNRHFPWQKQVKPSREFQKAIGWCTQIQRLNLPTFSVGYTGLQEHFAGQGQELC